MTDTTIPNQNAHQPLTNGWRKSARFLLVIYTLVLIGFAGWYQANPETWQSFTSQGVESIWIIETVTRLGISTARDLLLFSILGLLCGAACAPSLIGAGLPRVIVSVITGFVVASAIAIVANTLMRGLPLAPPTLLSGLIILLSSLYGSFLGATWMNSSHMIRWVITQTTLTITLLIGGCVSFAWYTVQSEPLSIATSEVATKDRRRLVSLFRSSDPRKLAPDELAELEITENDLNQLVNWALSLVPGDQRANVQLADAQVVIESTWKLPSIAGIDGYLNLISAGSLQTRGGELVYSPNRVSFGKRSVPHWLFRYSGPITIDEEWQHGAVGPFLRSLQSIEIGNQTATIAYSNLELDKDFVRNTLIEFGVLEDLEDSCSDQVSQLVKLAESSPSLTLSQCMQTAFTTAQRRSINGSAVRENRAAVLALGYLLGDYRIGTFVGGLEEPPTTAKKMFKQIKIRGRRDWTQHFTVSAALQVLGNRAASFDVGILKEELDADGGSGFSFGDLLADRSGTEFAGQVTASEQQALTYQNQIAGGFKEQDYFPPGTGLPEGIQARDFQEIYGGVGGAEYAKLLTEIDSRISALPGYNE